jgi:hypothetical protein
VSDGRHMDVCKTATNIGCDLHVWEINTTLFSSSVESETGDKSLVYMKRNELSPFFCKLVFDISRNLYSYSI